MSGARIFIQLDALQICCGSDDINWNENTTRTLRAVSSETSSSLLKNQQYIEFPSPSPFLPRYSWDFMKITIAFQRILPLIPRPASR